VYAAYADDRPVLLAPLSIQYAEFAHWQRQWVHDASLRDQLAYWKLQLRGPLRTRELPTEPPAAVRPHRAHQPENPLPCLALCFEELAALRSSGQMATLFMTSLAGFEILLHGLYTPGEQDMRSPRSWRIGIGTRPKGLIGLFADMVILRTDLGGNPGGREVLRRVRGAANHNRGLHHADFRSKSSSGILERERGPLARLLERVMVIWQNAALFQSQLAAPPVTFVDIDPAWACPQRRRSPRLTSFWSCANTPTA